MKSSLVVCLLTTLIILITIGLIYSISSYTTLPGGILISLIILWIFLRKAVEISLFPGSFWFWKRGLEQNYCKEMSLQITDKIRSLHEFLQNLIDLKPHLQESYSQNGKIIIASILENYEGMQCTLSKRQKRICKLLMLLQDNLENTRVVVNGRENFSLWEWIEIRLECPQIDSIYPTDVVSSSSIVSAISVCEDIESLLEKSFVPLNCIQKLWRWIFDDTIGTMDYMRVDLMKRFNCEEVFLYNGQVKISWY